MNDSINFGIDLGTTNSAIAKFIKGDVIIFNNPLDYGRSSLPSVVYYRKDRIVVGTKAKEYLERDPINVVGLFKRKMGTSESYKIKSINQSKTPIELSAQVLKELKNFVNTGEILKSVVITIPASFDLIQSNATKEAGYLAGFEQVVLLQEPIAASLAYANMKKTNELEDGQWLVYDLGGGTFDVALVRIKDGEMKIVDHEGNNFLGGSDYDRLIVEKLIIPKITEEYNFKDLEKQMKSAKGKYNSKYFSLLNQAEDAKIRLSAVTSAEIIVERMKDDEGADVDMEIIITKSEFNSLIKSSIDETIEMINTILTRNSLTAKDIQFNLMVGGSTFIPFVRERVGEALQIPVNLEIDPTTAIAIGAAYYAATKSKKEIKNSKTDQSNIPISIKAAYSKASKETDELFAAKIIGEIEGLYYRIIDLDGGFDSGLKELSERINEDLPLVKDAYNEFSFTVYDNQNNIIKTDFNRITINSGFIISGQPVPEDICLEIDDLNNPGFTKLDLFIEKNTILPSKRTKTYPINNSIIKGSQDDVIKVNVIQGSHLALPASNKIIGYIEITGKNLSRDISKGSDIEITISFSESQDLTVSAYLNMADQEFKQTFNPKERNTPIDHLKEQVEELEVKIATEIYQATELKDWETAKSLEKIQKKLELVVEETSDLAADDVTDKRYQLEDKKRKLAQETDDTTKFKRIGKAKYLYAETKAKCFDILEKSGNDYEIKAYEGIIAQEEAFLSSENPTKILEKSDELNYIFMQILWRTPEFLVGIFGNLVGDQTKMNDQSQAKSLIDAGKFAIASKNWDRLSEINSGLLALLPKGTKEKITTKIGFG
jgi:molecular chaperone DnaK